MKVIIIAVFLLILLVFICCRRGEKFCNTGDKQLQITGDFSRCGRMIQERDDCNTPNCSVNFYVDQNDISQL